MQTQNTLEGLYSSSSLGMSGDPTEGAGKSGWGEGRLDYLAESAATATQPGISGCQWMDE